MVSQTRGMARSASRSAFINFQSRRIQTRSVVRTTLLFNSPPEDAPPPPIPQPRTRRRRALEPDPEEEEERPAKRRRVAPAPAPAAPAAPLLPPSPPRQPSSSPSPPPAILPPPSPPPANLPSPSPPPANLPPPPTAYVPSPVPSPTSIFPLRRGLSFNPLPTPEQAETAGFELALWREDMHGTWGSKRIHHEPPWRGPIKRSAAWPEIEVPSAEDIYLFRIEDEQRNQHKRMLEHLSGDLKTPYQRLERRMGRRNKPNDLEQEARRQQLTIDKREYMRDGTNLNTPSSFRYDTWTGSVLSTEVGWTWVGDDLYLERQDSK